jgi:hypothetical protein
MHEETIPVRPRRKQRSLKRPTTQNRSSRGYPSDLTEQEWAILEPLIPPAKEGGHPRTTDMREVLNALFYVDRTGCECAGLAARLSPVVYRLDVLPDLAERLAPGSACIRPCVKRRA